MVILTEAIVPADYRNVDILKKQIQSMLVCGVTMNVVIDILSRFKLTLSKILPLLHTIFSIFYAEYMPHPLHFTYIHIIIHIFLHISCIRL